MHSARDPEPAGGLEAAAGPDRLPAAREEPDRVQAGLARSTSETRATKDALAVLPDLGARTGAAPDVIKQLAEEYRQHMQMLQLADSVSDEPALCQHEQYTALWLAALAHKRATVLQPRDQQQIDDGALRQIQARLDLEELRLSWRHPVD